jgi:hypothetical protein
MFAASLDTSDADMFIEIPKSAWIQVQHLCIPWSTGSLAFLRAGESFTPSPVTEGSSDTSNDTKVRDTFRQQYVQALVPS